MSTLKLEVDPATRDWPAWAELVRQQVGSLRYGAVEIVVHDARVTQLERSERLRLDKPEFTAGPAQSHA